jgi:hypothetical protein
MLPLIMKIELFKELGDKELLTNDYPFSSPGLTFLFCKMSLLNKIRSHNLRRVHGTGRVFSI